MPINIARRDAFAKAFKFYPDILDKFVIGHCQLAEFNPKTNNHDLLPEIETENAEMKIMQICMAQFCARLVRTRAYNSGSEALEVFAEATIQRYKDYQFKSIGARVITAKRAHREALNVFEGNMVRVILEGLHAEVDIEIKAYNKKISEVNLNGGVVPDMEEFDEPSFWHDVFLALTMNQAKHHPTWAHPVNRVVLDHIDEFKSALVPS